MGWDGHFRDRAGAWVGHLRGVRDGCHGDGRLRRVLWRLALQRGGAGAWGWEGSMGMAPWRGGKLGSVGTAHGAGTMVALWQLPLPCPMPRLKASGWGWRGPAQQPVRAVPPVPLGHGRVGWAVGQGLEDRRVGTSGHQPWGLGARERRPLGYCGDTPLPLPGPWHSFPQAPAGLWSSALALAFGQVWSSARLVGVAGGTLNPAPRLQDSGFPLPHPNLGAQGP